MSLQNSLRNRGQIRAEALARWRGRDAEAYLAELADAERLAKALLLARSKRLGVMEAPAQIEEGLARGGSRRATKLDR